MLIKFNLFIVSFYLISLFCEKETDGFSIRRINSAPPLPFINQGEALPAQTILNQRFHYLARGGQMFVFVSEDQKYVLKFFKNSPNPLVPLKKYHSKKMGKLIRDIGGYLLAFERVPEESGLIYLKLDNKALFDQTVTLVDKLGISHKLSLQNTLFVIQKKGEPLNSYLQHSHDVQAVFNAMKDLIKIRRNHHIEDTDSHLSQNIGFIDGKLCFLDPGKFIDAPVQQAEYPEKFVTWVKIHYPEAKL
jgi:hypothetical protein